MNRFYEMYALTFFFFAQHGKKPSVSLLTTKRCLSRSWALSWMPPPLSGHHALRYSIHRLWFTDFLLSLTYLLVFFVFFLWGCVSAQRFVIIANDDVIETIIVEESAGELTVTEATAVLARL